MSTARPGEGLRIYVDLPWDASACMGTGAYSEAMVRALAGAAPGAEITLLVPLGQAWRIRLPNVRYASLPSSDGLSESTRQVALPSFLHEVEAHCLFAPASLVPAVKACPTVATVHDLAFETHRDQYSPALAEYLDRWLPVTLKSADRIVAISEPVRQDLLLRKRVEPGKVVVIEQPIREVFRRALGASELGDGLRSLGITGPYFFHVSNLGVHKNMEFGVRVLAEYLRRHPESNHQLLFGGGGFSPSQPPDLCLLARELGIGDRVRYVGKCPDQALKVLMQGSDAFFFPSLVEGWGLPVVEARSLGARVLSSPHVPSALPREKVKLDVAQWVAALESGPRAPDMSGIVSAEEAGARLLSVIAEAVRSNPSPPLAASLAAPHREPRVAIRGDWYSPSGFGQAARNVYQALETAGLNPEASLAPKDVIQDKRLWRGPVSLRRDLAELWIHHVPPDHIDLGLRGKHVTFFFWETDRIPEASARTLSGLSEIWAPSSFVAEVVRSSGVTVPVFPVAPPVDTDLFTPGPYRRRPSSLPDGFDPSWTVFLYVGTWDPRKRPDILTRSFTKAFSSQDRALLILKSYVTGDPAKDRDILNSWVSACRESDAHVQVIADVISSQEMADLFRLSTAFVTASRGEGYCLPAVQALSTGRPSLAPGWSAFTDYVSVPVDFEVETVPREVSLPGYGPDQRWAVVDEDDLSRKLRWIHENRDRATSLGEAGRQWVLRNASMSVVGARLKARIQALSAVLPKHKPQEVLA